MESLLYPEFSSYVPFYFCPGFLPFYLFDLLVAVGLLKKSRMFDKMMHMDQARNSTIKFINGMEAKS